MKTTTITRTEIEPMLIANLPTRPTAPTAFGGKGYTASEMKAAFDRLSIYVMDRLNMLIDDIISGDVCDSVPTGIAGAPTLDELLNAFTSGMLPSLIRIDSSTLTAYLDKLRADVDLLLEKAGLNKEAAE